MTNSKEQFEIMRRTMEEEHAKDIAALERLQRFLPSAETSSSTTQKSVALIAPPPVQEQDTEVELEPAERPTLIGAVLSVVQSKPNLSVTGRDVLTALESQDFPLVGDERRRLTSIGQALSKLAERDPAPIRITRRGKGKAPNMYRAIVQTINPAHLPNGTAPGAAVSSEMTM
jgi:hypothetical protein